VALGNVDSTQKLDPHLQGSNEKAEIYMKVFYAIVARSYVTKELWTVIH